MLFLSAVGTRAESVTVAWDANRETDLAGYRVYYGPDKAPPTKVDVGRNTSLTLTNLAGNTPYYFYATAYNTAGLESDPSAQVVYTPPSTPLDTGARFIEADRQTGGRWKGHFGSDGYTIAADSTQNPPYATVVLAGNAQWVWNDSTSDPVALERGASAAKLAACWYSPSAYDIQFNLTGSSPRRVTLYCLDWDWLNRRQKIELIETSSGTVLDSQSISNFQKGIYLTWEITKPVTARITSSSGPNAVVSGIFFDSMGIVSAPEIAPSGATFSQSVTVSLASATPNAEIHYTLDASTPTAVSPLYAGPFTLTNTTVVTVRAFKSGLTESAIRSATFSRVESSGKVQFLSSNTARKGTWKGSVGLEGHAIATETPALPSFAALTFSGASSWIWNFPANTDLSALERPYQNARIASTWYSSSSFDLLVKQSDNLPHALSFYFLDYDQAGRVQKVELLDPDTQLVLDATEISAFGQGLWLQYECRGSVLLRLTRVLGPNAVLSGLFFDSAQTP
ncbi:MAG TPA: chitobiase/beta-hexosaminidase C-terminal domain-containing protein [Verrucomicrobiae bacterium]|nr:chitobiase/beta-hexosaminidase C-terminal domain-containing protein [Verrucomicrobiae bacterium]